MDVFNLNVENNNIGGYFSSEQLELLTIIKCKTYDELINFVINCKQLNGVFINFDNLKNQDLEKAKRFVFESYQNTLVPHNSDKNIVLQNTLNRLELKNEDIEVIKKIGNPRSKENINYIKDYIKRRYENHREIFLQINRFISLERDQNKDSNLYEELTFVNEKLSSFNTLLLGSLKPELVINFLLDENDENRFDYYFAKRDFEFAKNEGKHIRFHSLLTKTACEKLFEGRTKEEILVILKDYVKSTIDFVNKTNAEYKLNDGTNIIESIDLFNEIVSFDVNEQGEYENIWEKKHGITIDDITDVFSYALENKPDGVSYLYNEPFLEDPKRRKKVLEVLNEINSKSPNLIDTIGSQMHITFRTTNEDIKSCFEDLKLLQENGINTQITEFDLSLGEYETLKLLDKNSKISYETVYEMKKEKVEKISSIINDVSIKLDGISYWSLTDNIDCNLERVRTNLLNKNMIKDINEIPTVCGGLFPTSKEYVNSMTGYEAENMKKMSM